MVTVLSLTVLAMCLNSGVSAAPFGVGGDDDVKDQQFQECCASKDAVQSYPGGGLDYCHYNISTTPSLVRVFLSKHPRFDGSDANLEQTEALIDAVVGCGTNGKNDTQCCKDSGVVPQACLPFCNGTPPVNVQISEDMVQCANDDVGDAMSKCWYDNA